MKDLIQNYDELLSMNGYDDCMMGICHRFGQEPIIAYDQKKVLAKMIDQGMTIEEAQEFFEYNQLGAGMGDLTPCFIETPEEI
jgi:hypothetical protein